MANKFRNRLVGAIILVALGVILLPSLLDGHKKYYQETFSAIPLVPHQVVPKAQQPIIGSLSPYLKNNNENKANNESKLPLSSANEGSDSKLKSHNDTPELISTKVESKLQETILPKAQAYVIQLGALRNIDKVKQITQSLRTAGFTVYTIPSTPIKGEITRIFVGPELSKDKLNAQLTTLEKMSGLSGQVKLYQP